MADRKTTEDPREHVIKVDLWDRARWRGVLFVVGTGRALAALVFQDRDAAAEIFSDWIDRFGATDPENQVRVAFIEGDIPGQTPGYTVHITPNAEHILNAADRARERGQSYAAYFSRLQRMDNPQSVHLARFKAVVAETKRFQFAPAVFDAQQRPLINEALAIEKRSVVFRQAAEITQPNDIDSIVVARPEGRAARWN